MRPEGDVQGDGFVLRSTRTRDEDMAEGVDSIAVHTPTMPTGFVRSAYRRLAARLERELRANGPLPKTEDALLERRFFD